VGPRWPSQVHPFRCGILAIAIHFVACAGPRYQYTTPPVVSETEIQACDTFARQTVENTGKAREARDRGAPKNILFIGDIVLLPVIVPALVSALALKGPKLSDEIYPENVTREQEYKTLMEVCLGPTVVASRVGPMHPAVALAYVSLADQYLRAGKFNDAVESYRRAVAIQEKVLGPDHPDLAGTLSSYATALSRAGREPEATVVSDREAAIRTKAATRPGTVPIKRIPGPPYIVTRAPRPRPDGLRSRPQCRAIVRVACGLPSSARAPDDLGVHARPWPA
jgi:hypothetical protein